MTTALQGWHPGELTVQRKLGYVDAVSDRWQYSQNYMTEQHRTFHTSNLPFIPVTTVDECGRPWASVMAGATGEIGFVKSPDAYTLTVRLKLWEGEPLLDTIRAWLKLKTKQAAASERFLIAGIGIEFTTRRRNKFAGRIIGVKPITDLIFELDLRITETLGNCPKYINVRNFVPHAATNPSVAYQNLHMTPSERLPDEAIDLITNADTVFIGSVYTSESTTAAKYPSHAGMNSRGGLPGFIRVMPSDGRSVVVPDYSGNRFLMSLGNIESSGLAALTFVNFTTGDVLYITGKAQVLVGPPALEIMTRQACVTVVEATGYILVHDAFPVRQKPGLEVEHSVYSPKIKYLVDEPEALANATSGHKARLASAVQLARDIAVFKFKVDTKAGVKGLKVRPGQAIVLDFMDWIGPPQYRHMANDAPGSINDDRVRTWTMSSTHEDQDAAWFELTMREMEGGAVTGALFNLLRDHPHNEWGHSIKIDKTVVSDVVGVTGEFFMGPGAVHMLWVAGGIGITPFLSMLSALAARGAKAQGDVVLALAAREPDVFLKLTDAAIGKMSRRVAIRIDLFTKEEYADTRGCLGDRDNCRVFIHKGRIPKEYWAEVAGDRDVFICGPGGFGDAAVAGLRAAGVPTSKINREGFY